MEKVKLVLKDASIQALLFGEVKKSDLFGNIPNYVSVVDCFFKGEKWKCVNKKSNDSTGVNETEYDDSSCLENLGSAFEIIDENPKLVWEKYVK